MTLDHSTTDLTPNDLGLIDETIRRIGKVGPLTTQNQAVLRVVLQDELGRGRRDLFSLVRAARKALDHA